MTRRTARSTRTDSLCPYTTLFRSLERLDHRGRVDRGSVVEDGIGVEGEGEDRRILVSLELGRQVALQVQIGVVVHEAAEDELADGVFVDRSEEQTSELPSLMRVSYAAFCLKKNTNSTTPHNI